MKIMERRSFEEYDPVKVAYVEYEVFKRVPLCTDFKFGETRKIVLRNKATRKLERIEYTLSGGLSVDGSERRIRYWGRIRPECGMNLVFNFKVDGSIKDIEAVYSAPEDYEKSRMAMTKSRCPAEAAAFY